MKRRNMRRTRAGRVGLSGSMIVLLLAGLLAALRPAPTQAAEFADLAFRTVWDRTDNLVAGGKVARTWFWGPTPGATQQEEYADATGGKRLVQYFDKSRMEINNPGGDKS